MFGLLFKVLGNVTSVVFASVPFLSFVESAIMVFSDYVKQRILYY